MRKQNRVVSLLLSLLFAASLPMGVLADEKSLAPPVAVIRTEREFLAFAEQCRLDSWSRGRTFRLESDISLSGTDFTGVPTFGGVFEGNGHRISGFSAAQSGSEVGLFRFLQEGGVIRDLELHASLSPQGTHSVLGGLVAVNNGAIEGCSFSGAVSGGDTVGGLVGLNESTGVLRDCYVHGVVYGSHFVGGLVGENRGTVYHCFNTSSVNTTAAENEIDIKDLTIDSITGTENAAVITDIGGIAGRNAGVLRACVNSGTVGYEHVGYNIGGIAGSQTGYIEGCVNSGAVYGRKEVGGIAGQMEPDSTLIFSQDTLKKLSQELRTLKTLLNTACDNASAASNGLNRRLKKLRHQVDDAIEAADDLVDALQKLRLSVSVNNPVETDLDKLLDEAGLPNLSAPPLKDTPDAETPEEEPAPGGAPSEAPAETEEPAAPEAPAETEEPAAPEAPAETEQPAAPEAESAESESPSPAAYSGGLSLLPLALTPADDALGELLPDVSVELVNKDKVLSKYRDLSELLSDITDTMDDLVDTADEYNALLTSDLKAVNQEVNVILDLVIDALDEQTDESADDRTQDVSDEDTERDTTGKVANCKNTGSIRGDLNVGGVVGTMAFENDLDPEDDVTIEGNASLNYRYTARAVLRGCENSGTVSAKKRQAGGIVGSMDLGSVILCENSGTVDSPDCDYVGGIAGKSSATIRESSVKCRLLGHNYVGGVAGSGATIENCRVMLMIDEGTEALGSIAGALEEGYAKDSKTLAGNCFVENEWGGVGGVSYKDKAYPLSYAEFTALEGLDERFLHLSVTFRVDGEAVRVLSVPYGGAVSEDAIPDIPAKPGFHAEWEPFEQSAATFDTTVNAVYEPFTCVLESEQKLGVRPVLLAEGSFEKDGLLALSPSEAAPMGVNVLESWLAELSDDGADTHLFRYLPPEDAKSVGVWLQTENGWEKLAAEPDGSYLTFRASGLRFAFCAVREKTSVPALYVACAGAPAFLLVLLLALREKKRKIKNMPPKAE